MCTWLIFQCNSTINASRHPHWLSVRFIHWKTCSELKAGGPQQLPPQFRSINPTKITQLAGYMPYSSEISMQFYHQRIPWSALTDRSIYKGKNLLIINGWGPLATSGTVWVYKFNEIHAIDGQMPNWTEFSMQFYHQRFPSSALNERSIKKNK